MGTTAILADDHTQTDSAPRGAGFTLVELLIVIVILGILAAVVIPQFSDVAAESRASALDQDLSTMRKAIALYRVQHNEVYPGVGGWDQFVTQMTTKTDADGNSGTKYGPYVRPPFPANPVSLLSSGTTVATMPGAPTGTTGWIYATSVGEIRANTTGTGPTDVDYFDF